MSEPLIWVKWREGVLPMLDKRLVTKLLRAPFQCHQKPISYAAVFWSKVEHLPFDAPKLRSFDTNLNTSWTIWNVKRHEFLRDFKDSSNVVSLSEINTNDWLAWHIINPANLGNIFKLFPARSQGGLHYVHVSWDIRIRAIRLWHQFGAIKKPLQILNGEANGQIEIPFMDQWMKLVSKSTSQKVYGTRRVDSLE